MEQSILKLASHLIEKSDSTGLNLLMELQIKYNDKLKVIDLATNKILSVLSSEKKTETQNDS